MNPKNHARAVRYRQLALVELDRAKAAVLYKIADEAERDVLCTVDSTNLEGQMRDRCDDLIFRNAIFECPLHMKGKLVGPVQRNEGRNGHQASIARRQGGVFPNVAKRDLIGDLRQMGCKVSKRFSGICRFVGHE